jgi:hypothetical protein
MGINYGRNPFSFACHSPTFMRAGSSLIFMGINYSGNPFSFACYSPTFVRAGSALIFMGINYGRNPFSFAHLHEGRLRPHLHGDKLRPESIFICLSFPRRRESILLLQLLIQISSFRIFSLNQTDLSLLIPLLHLLFALNNLPNIICRLKLNPRMRPILFDKAYLHIVFMLPNTATQIIG